MAKHFLDSISLRIFNMADMGYVLVQVTVKIPLIRVKLLRAMNRNPDMYSCLCECSLTRDTDPQSDNCLFTYLFTKVSVARLTHRTQSQSTLLSKVVMYIAPYGNPSLSHEVSPAIWDHN